MRQYMRARVGTSIRASQCRCRRLGCCCRFGDPTHPIRMSPANRPVRWGERRLIDGLDRLMWKPQAGTRASLACISLIHACYPMAHAINQSSHVYGIGVRVRVRGKGYLPKPPSPQSKERTSEEITIPMPPQVATTNTTTTTAIPSDA